VSLTDLVLLKCMPTEHGPGNLPTRRVDRVTKAIPLVPVYKALGAFDVHTSISSGHQGALSVAPSRSQRRYQPSGWLTTITQNTYPDANYTYRFKLSRKDRNFHGRILVGKRL
jgi:hypothetical protein